MEIDSKTTDEVSDQLDNTQTKGFLLFKSL